MPLAYVALGSNLGEPLTQLQQARSGLETLGTVVAASSLYRTAPVGGPPGQEDYLNAVVVLEPLETDPEAFLKALLVLEAAHGRTRDVRWDARTLDLDLLAWDRLVCYSETLTLPHPRMMTRAFVLAPLYEVAPDWRHPLSGVRACDTLRASSGEGIERTTLAWGTSERVNRSRVNRTGLER